VPDIEIRQLFDHIDEDGSGEITTDELVGFIQKANKNLAAMNEKKKGRDILFNCGFSSLNHKFKMFNFV
jgi:hypothetical protein